MSPIYTAAYGQLDMSASYDINKHLSVMFDAINLTSASDAQYGGYPGAVYFCETRASLATRSAFA